MVRLWGPLAMERMSGGWSKVYVEAVVTKVVHRPSTCDIYLDIDMDILAGQFIMVWLPTYEEVPMAPSWDKPLRITVKPVGETTHALCRLKPGDKLYLRGPYGKGYSLDGGRYLLIGGGVGAAPLILAAKQISGLGGSGIYVEGVKTKDDAMFIGEASLLGFETRLYTEDGSSGYRGLATDILEEVDPRQYKILACGPEPMHRFLVANYGELDIELSMERIVKCGLGVCGSCVIEGTGLLVCLDGPVIHLSNLVSRGYPR